MNEVREMNLWQRADSHVRGWTFRQRLWRVPLILVTTFAITIALLAIFQGKAFALCKPGSSETTCPSPSVFQNKINNGFFNRANGVPYGQVLTTPAQDQDVFINKYQTYWNNHPGQRDNMYRHAANIAANPKTAISMARWNKAYPLHQTLIGTMKAAPIPAAAMARYRANQRAGGPNVIAHKPITNCFAPYTVSCEAKFEWQNLGDATKCGVFHAYPNVNNARTCDLFRNPTANDNPITKDQWQTGLSITFCVIDAGGAIAAVVTGPGLIA